VLIQQILLTVDSFIPIIIVHTLGYAWHKMLNVCCRAAAIFPREIGLYKLNIF